MEPTEIPSRRRMPTRSCKKKVATPPNRLQFEQKPQPSISNSKVVSENQVYTLTPPQSQENVFSTPSLPLPQIRKCSKKNCGEQKETVVSGTLPNRKQFIGRLEWMQGNSDKPVTSTPVFPQSKLFTQRDVNLCFGFDTQDNSEIFEDVNKTEQISSIHKDQIRGKEDDFTPPRSPLKQTDANNQFNSLLVRYGMQEEKKKEEERSFVVDKKDICKTYTKTKAVKFQIPDEENNAPKKKSRPRRNGSKKNKTTSDSVKTTQAESKTRNPKSGEKSVKQNKLAKEAEEWIEQKNLEFDRIMDFPMCVE